MLLYFLYEIGIYLSNHLPLGACYRIACFLADMHYFFYTMERDAVKENLKVILNNSLKDDELEIMTRNVFRNFAKYLVDFFRFSKIDADYLKDCVKLDGLSNIDDALKKGRGVIILSAHIGNWELGGFALGKLGYPINAVVLTHKEDRINDFFINQRALGNFKSIEMGASLRGCYSALRNNELLALLGDRNFSASGLTMEFFGRPVLLPKGPGALSVRTGAAIVCGYMVRQKDGTYRINFEKPIYPRQGALEDAAAIEVTREYLTSMERCLREYPDQWFVFKYFWGDN